MFGLNITRFMPRFARPLAARAAWLLADAMPLHSPFDGGRGRRSPGGDRVLVAGLFRSRSGLGRAAHLLARELEQAGRLAGRVDLTGSLHFAADADVGGDGAALLAPGDAAATGAGDLMVVANPPAYLKALGAFDRAWLQERAVIAHWVWELSVLPRSWRRQARFADEIWVPSDFVADAVRPAATAAGVPVRLKPYPADCDPFPRPSPQDRARTRRMFAIPPGAFCAGMSFSAASGFERKNPLAAIAAFREACAGIDAILLLRCPDLADRPALRALIAEAARGEGEGRIRIFDSPGQLDIRSFYALIDLYLAPVRSEGYGLNVVEAAQSGVPAIATAYGLAADIAARPEVETIGYRLVPARDRDGFYARLRGGKWAEPDHAQLVRQVAAHARRARVADA